jgi:hypothetical protein
MTPCPCLKIAGIPQMKNGTLQTEKRKTSFCLPQKETENGSFLGQQTINALFEKHLGIL